eukprot:282416-Chlamydomonas_euryale.AAC.1
MWPRNYAFDGLYVLRGNDRPQNAECIRQLHPLCAILAIAGCVGVELGLRGGRERMVVVEMILDNAAQPNSQPARPVGSGLTALGIKGAGSRPASQSIAFRGYGEGEEGGGFASQPAREEGSGDVAKGRKGAGSPTSQPEKRVQGMWRRKGEISGQPASSRSI